MLTDAAKLLLARARQLVERTVAGGESGLDMILLLYKDGHMSEQLISEDFSLQDEAVNTVAGRLLPDGDQKNVAIACIVSSVDKSTQVIALSEQQMSALIVGKIGWRDGIRKVRWDGTRPEDP